MHGATEEGKQALAAFAVDLIRKSTALTHLHITKNEFDNNSIAAICDAIFYANIRSLVKIYFSSNPAYFDTDGKCVAWAATFKKLPKLSLVCLDDCNISASNQEVLQLACPEGCWINFGS